MSGHLLTLGELGTEGIAELLALTDRFVEVGRRPIPRVPALRGRTVANAVLRGIHPHPSRVRDRCETVCRRT